MTKLIITGANGQVGWCLTRDAANYGFKDVVALDHKGLDITDKDAVFQTIAQEKPDVIINAAAYTAVDKAENDQEKAHLLNALAPGYLAEAAHKCNALFLHISTDYVFNGQKDTSYKETDPYAPLGVYGSTKMEGENNVLKADPESIILRTAWVFCEHGNNFVKTMLKLASRGTLGVVSDQYGGPTYAGDIADTLLTIAKKVLSNKSRNDVCGIYHYTGSPYVNWHEFAVQIFAEAEKQGLIKNIPTVNAIGTKDYPTPAKRPANSRLDMTKIKKVFDIDPSDWQKALKDLQLYMPQK